MLNLIKPPFLFPAKLEKIYLAVSSDLLVPGQQPFIAFYSPFKFASLSLYQKKTPATKI